MTSQQSGGKVKKVWRGRGGGRIHARHMGPGVVCPAKGGGGPLGTSESPRQNRITDPRYLDTSVRCQAKSCVDPAESDVGRE